MNKWWWVYMIFFLSFSCQKEELDIQNLNGQTILALGHGGMGVGHHYPMNSFESVQACLHHGMDGSEIDIQMTRDSVLVLYHGRDLSDLTDMKGVIHTMLWSEVQHAVYTFTPHASYSIISLDQLFANLTDVQDYTFTFDCKLYTQSREITAYYATFIRAIQRTIQQYQMGKKVYIESQSRDFLLLLKEKIPDSKLFIYPSSFEEGLETAISLGLYGITISTRNITREQIRKAHDHHIKVAIWNVHTHSDQVRAVRKNPDIIQTDHVRSLIKLLK